MNPALIRLTAVLGLCVCVSACAVFNMSSATYYRDEEGRFSQHVFKDITPEATTAKWLKQQFGEPVWVDNSENNVQICTWQFVKEQHKRRDVLLLLRYRNAKEEAEYLHVVLQDAVVVKHWRDVYESVDVARVIYSLGLEARDEQRKDISQNDSVGVTPEMALAADTKSIMASEMQATTMMHSTMQSKQEQPLTGPSMPRSTKSMEFNSKPNTAMSKSTMPSYKSARTHTVFAPPPAQFSGSKKEELKVGGNAGAIIDDKAVSDTASVNAEMVEAAKQQKSKPADADSLYQL